MVRHPVQAGVGEHEVVVAAARPLAEVAAGEAQAGRRAADARRRAEHRGGRVDADHLLDAQAVGDPGGQLPGPAAEVDGPTEPAVAASIRATRSQNGCARSVGELPYCAGIPPASAYKCRWRRTTRCAMFAT